MTSPHQNPYDRPGESQLRPVEIACVRIVLLHMQFSSL